MAEPEQLPDLTEIIEAAVAAREGMAAFVEALQRLQEAFRRADLESAPALIVAALYYEPEAATPGLSESGHSPPPEWHADEAYVPNRLFAGRLVCRDGAAVSIGLAGKLTGKPQDGNVSVLCHEDGHSETVRVPLYYLLGTLDDDDWGALRLDRLGWVLNFQLTAPDELKLMAGRFPVSAYGEHAATLREPPPAEASP